MDYRFTIALIYDFDGTLAPRQHAGVRLHTRRGQKQQGILDGGQHAGRRTGCRHGTDLYGTHVTGSQVERAVAAARGISGFGTPRDALQGREGVVCADQRLRRRTRDKNPALHQLVRDEGDHRRNSDRTRVPEDLCLFVSLRRRRHRLLARRGGQLHQQDAVHLPRSTKASNRYSTARW